MNEFRKVRETAENNKVENIADLQGFGDAMQKLGGEYKVTVKNIRNSAGEYIGEAIFEISDGNVVCSKLQASNGMEFVGRGATCKT